MNNQIFLSKNKGWLYEISFIRPILLILLVSYHAFCYNCGAWSVPEGVSTNDIYKWIALLSRAFRLEGFVFVSGYVFALQVLKKDKFHSLKQLFISKFKRLIIPCFLFGAVYYCLFCSGKSPWLIITGIGHLWYLPCLFWCFLCGYILWKSNLKYSSIFFILVLFLLLSVVPVPLQINKAMYYILFFYGGGLVYLYSNKIKLYVAKRNIILMYFLFILFLIGGNYLSENMSLVREEDLLIKSIILIINKVLKAITAILGIIAIYLTATRYMLTCSLKQWIIDIGNYGYGVYIFHQFILIYLYYHTTLSIHIKSIWLPWVGFILAIGGSLLLTWIF